MAGRESSLTEGWRAFELFAGRYDETRQFLGYLNEDPAPRRILFLHGDGGNGKSLLIRHLAARCCKRFQSENWDWVKNLDNSELMRNVAEAQGVEHLPVASLNFGLPPQGEDRPQEAFSALLMLRRALGPKGFRFPLFDFASVWYLHKTGGLSETRIRLLFPPEALDLVDGLVALITSSGLPRLGFDAFKFMQSSLGEPFTLYRARRKLDARDVEAVTLLDPHSELIYDLPRLFAADLNVCMGLPDAPSRLVLFFDSHEALSGPTRSLGYELYFERDEWLRTLLGHLKLESGIVAVVAGRQLPQWKDAPKTPIPGHVVQPLLIGHLSDTDARHFLENAGLDDVRLQTRLISFASVGPDEVHPFFLGLCADVALAAEASDTRLDTAELSLTKGIEQKTRVLMARLLRYVDRELETATRALCACRAFDGDVFVHLGKALNFQATDAVFETLTQFSFVWRSQLHTGARYRVHDLLRRLNMEQTDEVAIQAHRFLREHYRERYEKGDLPALAEAIYHSNQLDWEEGVTQWIHIFTNGIKTARYDICGILLEVRGDLRVEAESLTGLVLHVTADYFADLARHDEARRSYTSALAAFDAALDSDPRDAAVHNSRGIALQRLGTLEEGLAHVVDARDAYLNAIAAFDNALNLDPDDAFAAHNNRALAFLSLGGLEAQLTRNADARAAYRDAVTAFDRALEFAPDDPGAFSNRGVAFRRVGDLEARLSRSDDARAAYRDAVSALDRALELAPDDVDAHNNRGSALGRIGDLEVTLARSDDARIAYQEAVAAFDRALEVAPDYVGILVNRASSFARLGRLEADLARSEDARRAYEEAIATFDRALKLAPDNVMAHSNRGNALTNLGELEARLGRSDHARRAYTDAVAAFGRALQLAPAYAAGQNNRGSALRHLGNLERALARPDAARRAYQEAMAAFDIALQVGPDDALVHNNRAMALADIGELEEGLARIDDARRDYIDAVEAFDRALELAPDYVDGHNNRGNALARLGDLEARSGGNDDSRRAYDKAAAAFDRALELAPGDVAALTNRATVLVSVGTLEQRRGRHDAARDAYGQAITAFDRALVAAPEYVEILSNRGMVLQRRGDLEADLDRKDAARRSYRSAVVTFDRALRIHPDFARAHNGRGRALHSLGDLDVGLAARSAYGEAVAAFDRAIEITPDYVVAHNNRGIALAGMGELEARFSDSHAALNAYREAVAAFDRAIELAPDFAPAHRNRSLTLHAMEDLILL